MKKVLLLFTIGLFLAFSKPEQQNYVTVSGKVLNTKAKTLTFMNLISGNKKVIPLATDGSFSGTIKGETSSSYFLTEDEEPVKMVYLENGDTVEINYNSSNINETFSVTGKAKIVRDVARELVQIDKNNDIAQEDYLKNEHEFKKIAESIKYKKLSLLALSPNLPEEFEKRTIKNINYDYIYALNLYIRNHRKFTKNRDFTPSESFLKEVNSISLEDEAALKTNFSYRFVVMDLIERKTKEEYKKDPTANYGILYLKNLIKLKNETIRNSTMSFFVLNALKKDSEELYEMFMENCTDAEMKEKMEKRFAIIKNSDATIIKKGEPSPKFVNYENYAGGTSSLDDFKGKYVYIDIWATWCGPCIAQIPFLKKVEKQFHGKNIVFLSISVDKKKDKEKWRKMVAEKELGGVQLIADNNTTSQFIKDYQAGSIPRFILLDPQGKVISDRAPRPSEEAKLTELLNSLKL